MGRRALITGFEAYAGRSQNPSARLAQSLDGQLIAGIEITGRTLPVAYHGLFDRIAVCLDEAKPDIAIALGLWPGEPMIRLERFGLNHADFEIPDNGGTRLVDTPITAGGPTALAANLPLRAIAETLLAAGIPARLSSTAGSFLCNATLYSLLAATTQRMTGMLCGFIHLPYLPEQVAEMLAAAREGRLEMHQRADLASMDFAVMEKALRIVITVSAAQLSAA